MKRGLSHVEEILAFVIFVGFLVFALFFFNPFTSNRTIESSLDYASREIQNNATTSLEIYSVYITSSAQGVIGVPFVNADFTNKKSRVENPGGGKIPSSISGNNVYFSKPSGNFFAKIMVSENFPQDPPITGSVLQAGQYSISSSEKFNVYSESHLVALNSSYHSSYPELKKFLNLPTNVDFGFLIEFDDGKIINAERPVPESLEAFSRSQRVEVIRSTGDIGKVEFADLIVKVW